MEIDGVNYKSFTEVETSFGMTKGSLKKLVTKYNVPYKSLGRNNLITDKDLKTLLNRDSANKDKIHQEQSERMKKLVKEGKVGRKKTTSTTKS